MKTAAFLMLVVMGMAVGGCASTRQNTANQRPARLQLTVDANPIMSPLYEDEIAEAFAYRVSSSLHEQGFRGRIQYVERWETPRPNVPVLALSLMEWRVDRTGAVDCTFNATLTGNGQTQRLGFYHGNSFMVWPRRDWYARAQGYEEAVRDAVGTLAQRIEQSGLLEPMVTR